MAVFLETKENSVRRSFCVVLLFVLTIIPILALAGSPPRSGSVSAISGVPEKDLEYEDFQITDDGFITGYIVNSSGKARKGVQIDMWTTNRSETRILWRKNLSIGDLGPHEKRLVKEVYKNDDEEPAKTEIKFRTASGANFRNK
jgi:hypothetical protein